MRHRQEKPRDTVMHVAMVLWVAMLIVGCFLVYYVF